MSRRLSEALAKIKGSFAQHDFPSLYRLNPYPGRSHRILAQLKVLDLENIARDPNKSLHPSLPPIVTQTRDHASLFIPPNSSWPIQTLHPPSNRRPRSKPTDSKPHTIRSTLLSPSREITAQHPSTRLGGRSKSLERGWDGCEVRWEEEEGSAWNSREGG